MAITVAIEGYDELEQIGIGGMAAVYRARKVSIDKIVAIKLLFPYLATDESYIERFQREAKAAASIQHENVVNIIDFGESDGAFYIVMEYYNGRTLEQLMKERPGLPPEVALRILLEVAYGLEAAHALDIVHRDVKPANIIVTNQGGVKIADFGLARKTDSMTLITQHGKVVGTPAYMSPEQAAGRPVGPASDIFSFGVVAYELLSRRKPFEGQSYSDVLEKIQTFDPASVGTINPLISPELEDVVKRCLDKNEATRFANAAELVLALEAAMEKSQIARDRRQLAAYVKDPERYDSAFAEKTITECLSRGAFFLQKGKSHMDDAVLEYRRVLFLDPSHERALSNLDRLRANKNDKNDAARTVMIDATPTAARAAVKPGMHKTRAWRGGIAVLALVVIAGSIALMSRDRATDPVALPDTQAHRNDTVSDSLKMAVVTPPKPALDTSRKTMSASSSDAGVTPIADTTTNKPAPAKTNHDSNDRSSVKHEAKKAAHSAAVPGSLSVYFLGGVGNVWVDGKFFPYQPPFDKAPLSAGKHRVSCRMSDDKDSQELTVEIRSGQETVVEYEVGKTPVVSDE